jgi:hypothetical protein
MTYFPLGYWFKRMVPSCGGGRRIPASPHRHRSRLVLESLEGRWVPSTVTNLNDAGAGSLRQAIIDTSSGGTVDFQDGLSGTITLTSGVLTIDNDLIIAGPGSSVITVSGDGASEVFNIRPMSTVSISELTIANGYDGPPYSVGGGIYNGGMLTITNSTLSGNSVDGAHTYGGAIYNTGTLTITASTVSGNSISANTPTAFAGGGGVANFGHLLINRSAVSGNTAVSVHGSSGGGIYEGATGTTVITNSTISGNHVGGTGGGVIANMICGNTIVAGNTAGSAPDVAGTLTSQGYNLIGDRTGGSGYVSTDLVGTANMPIDPMLGPLQDNGGPTQTMALLPGSPALNAGDPAQLGVADQRGVVRSGGINIGAYQASARAFAIAAPDTVTSGLPFDVTVTAVDPFGQVAVGYTGTVTFSSSDGDPAVVLPSDYTFTVADAGMVGFPGRVTLITEGDQTITATDTSDGTITGTATVTVISGNAPRLVWTVASEPATPGTVPSNGQAAHESSEGQPARSEATSVPVPLATARHAQDAVFEAWYTVTDGLALNWT